MASSMALLNTLVRLIVAHRKFDRAVLKVSYREDDEIRIELFFLGSSLLEIQFGRIH